MMLVEDLPIRAQHVGLADFPWVEGVGSSGLMEYQKPFMQDAIVLIVAPFGLRDLVSGGDGPERFGEVESGIVGQIVLAGCFGISIKFSAVHLWFLLFCGGVECNA